jgi:hypothetical protein
MRVRYALGAVGLAALVLTGAAPDPSLKSGPQVGSSNISPFNPLHCSGPTEGTKICLV